MWIEPLSGDADTPRHEVQAAYAELVEAVRALQILQASEGWRELQKIIESNAATVVASLNLRAFSSEGDVYSDQWMKGTVNGLRRVPILLDESVKLYLRNRDALAELLKEGQEDGATESESDADSEHTNGRYTGLDNTDDAYAP